MKRPHLITQTWRRKGWNQVLRKWEYTPIVKVKLHKGDKAINIKRELWIGFIEKGWLSVTEDLRRWLDENGYDNNK